MSETKITDLVPQETIDKIKELNTEIQTLLNTYTTTAKELAKGVDVNVKVVGDIDKLEKLLVDKTKEATIATERLNAAISEQSQVVANTTNTISRQLMEQERVNKTQREAYTEHEKVKKLLDQFHDTYEGQIQRLMQVEAALKKNNEAQKANEKALKAGTLSAEEYQQKQAILIAQARQMRQEKSLLNQLLTAEEKANLSVESSYAHMSQQLELLKKAYKQLSEEGRDLEYGKELEETIQNLDAHLKDLAADQGEFQRNVGNYAIACQNGVASTEDLNRVLQLNAATIDGCIEQNKSLEKAKNQLDQSDENYVETLDKINAKIEENRSRIMDVSDVMEKMPSTVEEAEEQNKRLAAALKMVDVNADGASETIQQYRERIDANNEMVERVTGSNEEYADSLLSIIGVNSNFGQSFQSLANSGGHSFIDGLNTKVKAFGKTLMGLIANPWVLALLGIAGVAAGFKWWYDYNDGLVEATKLTKDFTGLSGSELKAVRNEVQAVAESYDKDFKEVLEAANAMSKQFGISVQESLKMIEDGFAAGADVNGEFLENIKEYPAYFKEAGISASEFIAITTQANQAGIYSDKGIDVIKEGNLRIREMTKATAEALDAIGISSKEAQKALADGSKTTFDIMQEISEKLAEFPESSSEVGTALADIFGGPGEDAGLQYILTLKDIDTNLDNVKDRAGELGKLQEEQLRSQVELENVIASVFDATGGSFESMTTKAKIFVNDGIVTIIKGCMDIVNWFVNIYNEAIHVRVCVGTVVAVFKTLWTVAKSLFELLFSGFKGVGGVLEGIMLIFSGELEKGMDRIKESFVSGFKNMKDIAVDAGKEIGKNFADELSNVAERRLSNVSIGLNVNTSKGKTPAKGKDNNDSKDKSDYTIKETETEKKAREKAAKEAEKQAKEELKRINELEESKISVMAKGHEKELAMIRLKFKKKIDEIKGDGETENALRVQLAEQCQKEIADCELKYQTELAKINLENRLASVKKGSKEEFDLKLAQLEASRAAELKAAEKTGADVTLINAKFNKERLVLEEEYANNLADKITERYGVEEITRNQEYSNAVNALKERYTKEMALAAGNAAKQEEIKRNLENDLYALGVEYSQKSGEAAIKMIEEILNLENLSAEDRLKWEQELAKAKINLANQIADANAESVDRQIADDDRLREKRLENAQYWLQKAGEALSAINDLMGAVFDGQIEKLEANQEANEEASEAEQERIVKLVEQNVITEEEGEARKRAAEERTAKKTEELEKKKAQIKHKQAIFDKALSVANIGLNTAMALMQLWVKPGWPVAIPMMAVVGALGALQLATVLATPIPKYAKGTDYHRGGPAIVGDGGKHEVIVFGGNSWITPDKPTLVNIPEGASVIPDIFEYDDNIPSFINAVPGADSPRIIVNNDYKKLEEKMDRVIFLFRKLNDSRRDDETNNYLEIIKLQKGL